MSLSPLRIPSYAEAVVAPEAAWERPTPFGAAAPLPPFPTDALPAWLRAYVEAEAEATQTPPDMAAMFALATLATVAGGRVVVEARPGWREGVNLFVAVAMEPGSRKSAVHRGVTAPVVDHERRAVEAARPQVAEAEGRRRIAEARRAEAEKAAARATTDRMEKEAEAAEAARDLDEFVVPAVPRLFTADATPEAVVSLLAAHGGRTAVLSAEGGVFDLMAGRYSNGIPNLDVFLSGHAGDALKVDRKGRPPEFVERPALTIGVAVQPYVLAKAARCAEMGGRGLLDRFLYALPPGNVGWRKVEPEPVPEAVRASYTHNVLALAESLDARTEPAVLTLAPEADRLLTAWRAELEPRRRPGADLGHVQGWASKLDGATARIAGLLNLAGHADPANPGAVSPAAMAAAVRIARYLVAHALAAFAAMGTDPVLEGVSHVLPWVAARAGGGFTRRDCHRAHAARFPKAADLDPVLGLLEDHGVVRRAAEEARGPKGGRPSTVFEVNSYATELTEPTKPGDRRGSVSSVGFVAGSPALLTEETGAARG